MSEFAISTSLLTKTFGKVTAVDNLDLNVKPGTIYGFLGPNGSGKSTTIRMLTGLLRPTTGDINVLGFTLPKDAEALRHKIGYMTQKFSLYQDLTVRENLEFVGGIYGMPKPVLRERLNEQMSIYDLEKIANQRANSLSGGQRQRLALAAATIHDPDLLFLDEPTSAVDPENRREFWERLFDLCNTGKTILVSTHYMDEAERCHRLAILDYGKKLADGSPQQLMEDMNASVVEIENEKSDLRQTKSTVLKLEKVISAAQLGTRLRVLVNNCVDDPETYLKDALDQHFVLATVRPSLEDVFITSTGKHHGDN